MTSGCSLSFLLMILVTSSNCVHLYGQDIFEIAVDVERNDVAADDFITIDTVDSFGGFGYSQSLAEFELPVVHHKDKEGVVNKMNGKINAQEQRKSKLIDTEDNEVSDIINENKLETEVDTEDDKNLIKLFVECDTKEYKDITKEEFKEPFLAVEKNDLQLMESMRTDESPDDLTPTHSADIKDLLSDEIDEGSRKINAFIHEDNSETDMNTEDDLNLMKASVESDTKEYKDITNEDFKETFVAVEKNDLQSKDSMTTEESPDDLTPTHSAGIKDLLSDEIKEGSRKINSFIHEDNSETEVDTEDDLNLMKAFVESDTNEYKDITNKDFKETFVDVEKNDLKSKDSMTTDESPDDLTPTLSADIKDLLSDEIEEGSRKINSKSVGISSNDKIKMSKESSDMERNENWKSKQQDYETFGEFSSGKVYRQQILIFMLIISKLYIR